MMPGHNDYETSAFAQQAEQQISQYGECAPAGFYGSTEPVSGCAGRLDATGWDGAEDTDPSMELDLSQWDAPPGAPMAWAMRWDAGDEHPDLPQRMRLVGAL